MQDLIQRIYAKIKDLHAENEARTLRGEPLDHESIELLRDAREAINGISEINMQGAIDVDGVFVTPSTYRAMERRAHQAENKIEFLKVQLREVGDICCRAGVTRYANNAEVMVKAMAEQLQRLRAENTELRDDLTFIHDLTEAPMETRATMAVAELRRAHDQAKHEIEKINQGGGSLKRTQDENEDLRSRLSRILDHARRTVLAVTGQYYGGSSISECLDKLKKLSERPALFFENLHIDGEPVTVSDVIAMRQEMGRLKSKLHNAKATKKRISRSLTKNKAEADYVIKELRKRTLPERPTFEAVKDRLIDHVIDDWKRDLATWIDSTSRLLASQGREVSRRLDDALRRLRS